MDKAFHKRLIQGYERDSHWKRIFDILDINAKLQIDDGDVELSFVHNPKDKLIYYKSKFIDLKRLYIL